MDPLKKYKENFSGTTGLKWERPQGAAGLISMPGLRLFIIGIASFWLVSLVLLNELHGAEIPSDGPGILYAQAGSQPTDGTDPVTGGPAEAPPATGGAQPAVMNPGDPNTVTGEPEYSPLNPDRYQGPLKQSDLRIEAVRDSLAQSQLPPAKLRLIFGHQKDDYLYFYDLEGHSIKIHYRYSKFDRPMIQKYKVLIPGIAYEIDIQFKGLEDKGQLYEVNENGTVTQDVAGRAKNPRSVLVFKISGFKILRLESIRF